MGNIEPEDRKVPISISLSAKSWKRIDEFMLMHENGGMNRSQFFETISTWYIEEREREKSQNPGENQKHAYGFTARQINNYFEDLERYLRLSDMEEVRKLLPIIRHANQLAQNLTRKVKCDISKITELDPIEKIRLENTRKAHEYRDKHEGAAIATETELVALKLKPAKQEPNIDIEIIEDEVPNPHAKGETVFQ